MKANKARRRLAKIEALMSNVTERYSAGEPHIKKLLEDAKAAVARAIEAVSVHASSRTAKNPAKRKSGAAGRKTRQEAPQRRRGEKRALAAKVDITAKRATPARKKVAVKRAAVKTPNKSALIKKAAKKTAPAPVQVAMEAVAREPTPKGA